jgi:hypothetical protein
MFRLAPAIAVAALAVMAAVPAFAADYNQPLRGSFADEGWGESGDDGDSLNFELGLRYFYSKGSESFSVAGTSVTDSDTTHVLEAHFRINDEATRYYVKGLFGYSMVMSADGMSPTLSGTTTDGHVAYAGGDIGYEPFGDPSGNLRLGFFTGYQYWNDSPDLGRANFTTGTTANDFTFIPATGTFVGPGNSNPQDFTVHALRLGVSGDARLGPMFDLSGEVAAVPYAKVYGTLGSFSTYVDNGTTTTMQSSSADLDGWGYGVMGQAMVGFHPTDNMTIRVGGRAWYLRGWTDTTFNSVTVTDSVDANNHPTAVLGTQRYISTGNPFDLFRYGALAELTYNF